MSREIEIANSKRGACNILKVEEAALQIGNKRQGKHGPRHKKLLLD